MTTKNIEVIKTVSHASELDKEIKKISQIYGATKVKIGMELASRLKEINNGKLYKLLDPESYTSFFKYVESIGIKYSTAMTLIGIYDTYILAGGYTIDQLAEIPYNALSIWKHYLFKKEGEGYILNRPKKELKEIIESAEKLTIDDNRQSRNDLEAGPEHKHTFEIFTTKICSGCKLKEYQGKRKE